jgi:hypothetical protein
MQPDLRCQKNINNTKSKNKKKKYVPDSVVDSRPFVIDTEMRRSDCTLFNTYNSVTSNSNSRGNCSGGTIVDTNNDQVVISSHTESGVASSIKGSQQ